MTKLKELILKYRIQLLFLAAGAIGGYLYWKYIGCLSGTCPIKSVWYWSTLWGAAFGFLIGDLIMDLIKKREKRAKDEK
jgi:hypothetical protein